MSLVLTGEERAIAAGDDGAAIAMRIVAESARLLGAPRLIPVASAHIDGALYHGDSGTLFAERLVERGARVAVRSTLNVGALDLVGCARVRLEEPERGMARRMMEAYRRLGCEQSWTCAPYQAGHRPAKGVDVAWGESNAVVFCNSVLGARTNRYGDFLDICAALTARVPDAGLHQDAHRFGQVLYDLRGLPEHVRRHELLPAVLGHYIGHTTGNHIPVIVGLPPDTSEDNLKLLGAAAASSGSVALFHAVGVTPEAPTVAAAFGGRPPLREEQVTLAALNAARAELSTTRGGTLRTVSLGTPHASLAEIGQLVPLVAGQTIHPEVDFYVSTGRDVLAQAAERGWVEICEQAGVRFVVDTCTYITPILRHTDGVAMTNSPKWAYYAPGNLGVDVVFASLAACVASALRGEVQRDADWA